MKKKLYDFSLGTAIIVVLAYSVIFTFSLFIMNKDDLITVTEIILNVILMLSFLMLFIYFVIFAPVVSNTRVTHLSRSIPVEDVYWFTRPNYLLRYDEIVFRDKKIRYTKLSNKEVRKNEIRVQWFSKYEQYLEDIFGLAKKNDGGTDE